MKLSNNKVIITGGGSGIGLTMAKSFLKEGSKVIITGRNEEKLKKACAENAGLEYFVCDIVNDEQIKALVKKCEAEGEINVLVNNAGVFTEMNYRDDSLTLDEQLKEIDIDFAGPIKMTHYFLPMLKKQKEAALVNVSSGLAFVPLTLTPIYCATKAGLHSWSRSLRFQLSKSTVKVFELLPPLTDTDLISEEFKKFNPISTDKLIEGFMKDFSANNYEIKVGQSKQLKMMSRLAPSFIFKKLNETFS